MFSLMMYLNAYAAYIIIYNLTDVSYYLITISSSMGGLSRLHFAHLEGSVPWLAL